MKNILSLILLILLMPLSLAVEWKVNTSIDISNITSQENFLQFDRMNSSTIISQAHNQTLSFIPSCKYEKGMAVVPACGSVLFGTVKINSSFTFGTPNSIQIGDSVGGDAAWRHTLGASEQGTVLANCLQFSGEKPNQNQLMDGDPAGSGCTNTLTWSRPADAEPKQYGISAACGAPSAYGIRFSNSTSRWVQLMVSNTGRFFMSNFTNWNGFASSAGNDANYAVYAVDTGHIWCSEIYFLNQNPAINISANTTCYHPLSTSGLSSVNLTYRAKSSGQGSIRYTFDDSSWTSVTNGTEVAVSADSIRVCVEAFNTTAMEMLISPVVPDTTPPSLSYCNITSEGGLGQNCFGPPTPQTNDTTFTLTANFSETTIAGLTINKTQTYVQCTTTNAVFNICTLSEALPIGMNNVTLNWSDANGNKNQTMILVNTTDGTAPNITLFSLANNSVFLTGFNDTGTKQFNWSATDNYYSTMRNCSIFIDDLLQHSVAPYTNNTNISSNLTISSFSEDIHKWNVTCIDFANNLGVSAFRQFEIVALQVNFTLYEHHNNTLLYLGANTPFNYSANFSENIASCYLIINNRTNQTNTSTIVSKQKANFTSNLTQGDYSWGIGCNSTNGVQKNSTDRFNLYINSLPTIAFNEPTPSNRSVIRTSYFLINVSYTGHIDSFVLDFNGVNQTIASFNSTLNLLINRTGLEELTTYRYRIYVNDTNGFWNNTGDRYLSTNFVGLIVGISDGVNLTFKPYFVNTTIRVQNISCSGQNETIGCLNLSSISSEVINVSLMWNITSDPPNQKILEDFSIDALNWSVYQSRVNNSVNRTLVESSITCGEIQSLNGTGLIEYRFNSTIASAYVSGSNITSPINLTFPCPTPNYYWRIFNGTKGNRTSFDYLNFSWKGDNTSNTFIVSVIDQLGNKASSPTLSMKNPNQFNSSGIALGTLRNVTTINISVTNVSGTLGLSGFLMGDIKLTNSTFTSSSRIRMKAGCTSNYANSTQLLDKVLTPMCLIQNMTTTNYIWLWQDINFTQKGLSWQIRYNATAVN